MSEAFRTMKEIIVEAAEKGCRIVLPRSDELQIDIDTPAQFSQFQALLPLLREDFPRAVYRKAPSPSGKPERCHITVTLGQEIDNATRIFYQAVMGSDPKREALNFRRHRAGDPHPSLFFEKGQP